MENQSIRLYNLFPRYYENCLQWSLEFPRIKKMGFNAVYINPFHYAGFSGSLYAPKDYYAINPIFIDPISDKEPFEQLREMLQSAHDLGLKVIMDLVINHTAKDHPFTYEHPAWYVHDNNNELMSPGAWENGAWISWGDLAQIDNASSPDKEALWDYWKELICFYIDLGFDGFRADAAYQVPQDLWKELIKTARNANSDILFLAESLGGTLEQSKVLAQCGFDYLFSSAKWWDFEEPWFFEQHNILSPLIKSIAFPESHDTIRAASELNNNTAIMKRKLSFTGLISAGWMIITGTEYGWQHKPNVLTTTPSDKENMMLDLENFITNINDLRDRFPIFNSEGIIIPRDHENIDHILCFEKINTKTDQCLFFVINKTLSDTAFHTFNFTDFLQSTENPQLIFSSADESYFEQSQIPLKPAEIKLFVFEKRKP